MLNITHYQRNANYNHKEIPSHTDQNVAAAAAKSLQSCPTLGDPTDGSPRQQPTRLTCPWDPPGKNTGVGSHFLLQGIFLTQGSNLHLLQVSYTAGRFFTAEPPGKMTWEIIREK